MKILDIKHVESGKTRTDGRYPLRIGSEVMFFAEPCIGDVMCLSYIKDNQGNSKDGILKTSTVQSIDRKESEIIVTTRNSIYCFLVTHATEKGGKDDAD